MGGFVVMSYIELGPLNGCKKKFVIRITQHTSPTTALLHKATPLYNYSTKATKISHL